MSEKLCLQWNNFKENVNSAFRKLRGDKGFTDVTLVCEDGQQMEAHKVILASSSPFFEKILQKSKHPHPLIYLKGFKSKDFASILDFLYFGAANIYQEDLDSFIAIAEEIKIKLKGLTEQTSNELLEDQKEPKMCIEMSPSNIDKTEQIPDNALMKSSRTVAIPNNSGGNLQALDEKVKSMMEKGQKMIHTGEKNMNGTPMQRTSSICRVCGKEGLSKHIRNHIEANHLEGISISCDHCDKTFSSRNGLATHKSRTHK